MEDKKQALEQYYKAHDINPENFTNLGDANVLIQSFGFEVAPGETDKFGDVVDGVRRPISYMPRKERTFEWEYDVSNEESKDEYVSEVKNAIERMKIWRILLERQLREIEELGYPKTTVYHPEFSERDMEMYPVQ